MKKTVQSAPAEFASRVCALGALALLILLGQAHAARAQWVTSGGNTTHTNPGGKIGVGTDSPVVKLDLTFDGAAEQGLRIFDTRPAGTDSGGHLLRFYTNNGAATSSVVERIRINSAGNVGIHVTAPARSSARRSSRWRRASARYRCASACSEPHPPPGLERRV